MGSGKSGLYSGTHGAKQNVPIKKNGDFRYSAKKTITYLLNINHKDGGSKARFIRDVLGYTQNDVKLFHKNVVSAIKGKTPYSSTVTPYGLRHVYHTELVGKNGKSITANVVVVVQKDNGRTTYKIEPCIQIKGGNFMKELDGVQLIKEFGGLPVGSKGVIVHVDPGGKDFEVEYFDKNGDTIDVIMTPACNLVLRYED